MRRQSSRLILFLLICVVLPSGCPGRVEGPGIQFAAEKHDFGSVAQGKIITHDFSFSNNGTETLFIFVIVSSCDCIYIRNFSKEVEPGKSGTITVSMNTKNITGKTAKFILVKTNIPNKPNITLVMEGEVKPGPPGAGVDQKGDAGASAFIWRMQSGETVIDTAVSSSTEVKIAFAEAFSGIPKIIATVRHDDGRGGGEAFVVTVRSVTNAYCIANITRVDKPLPWTRRLLLDWLAWE